MQQQAVLVALGAMVALVAAVLAVLLWRMFRRESQERRAERAAVERRARQVDALRDWLGDDHEIVRGGRRGPARDDSAPKRLALWAVARVAGGHPAVMARQLPLPFHRGPR